MTRTKEGLEALLALLTALAKEFDFATVTPMRNQALPTRMVELKEGVVAYLNLWDGTSDPSANDELLGADLVSETDGSTSLIPNAYEITHLAKLEWAVSGKNDEVRERLFDDALVAFAKALQADRTLGGVVSHCQIVAPLNWAGSGLSTDGMPHITAVEITIELQFVSSLPF